jgi:magnesium transporter
MKTPVRRKRIREKRIEGLAPPGAAPGTLIAQPDLPPPTIRRISYGPGSVSEETVESLDALEESFERWPVTWVDVSGLGDVDTIRRIGEIFHLHPLALEDILNVHQRAKVEMYGDDLFMVCRMPTVGEHHLETEQIGLFLGKNFVLSFQERLGDCLDPVRSRIRGGQGYLRAAGPDYLLYALVDAIVDSYFPVIEEYGDRVDGFEEEILRHPRKDVIRRIHAVKRDLIGLRRIVWPLRDAVQALSRETGALLTEETRLFVRDTFDHAVRIIELVENDRELASALVDLHLSILSHRMNDVMRVLTVIATIFIPLSFITGVYGMNFDPEASRWNMPELEWALGYPFALALMAGVALLLLSYFRRKGWIGRGARIDQLPTSVGGGDAAPSEIP